MTDSKPKSTKKFGVFPPRPLAAGLLARHVIATLPDSLAARRQLLDAVRCLAPPDSLGGDHAALRLETLQRHETLRQTIVSTRKEP